MLPPSVELPLVLGRLLALLRNEAHITQRAFCGSMGIAQGTLAWIEAGRANAYVAQLLLFEQGLMERGVLTRHGQVLELLDLVIAELAGRGVAIKQGRVASLAERDEVAELDRIVAAVVQGFFDRARRERAASVLLTGDAAEGGTTYDCLPRGPVTRRRQREEPGDEG
ncbi:MAG: helix-turn-helix domain-containing protein [Pseudomonadota bacterium]